jgi:hypothetical protein
MWVARSQKPMQSARVLPPPPGALGVDSLGLVDAVLVDRVPPGETTDPPEEIAVGNCCDKGAGAVSSVIGAAVADAGAATVGAGGLGRAVDAASALAVSAFDLDEVLAGLAAVLGKDMPPLRATLELTLEP